MNFTQHWRTPDLPTDRFRLTVDRGLLFDFYVQLEPSLREWASTDDDLPDFVNELARRGWPPPAQVIADDRLLEELLGFYGFDIRLGGELHRSGRQAHRVVLTGEVGSVRQRTAYQDF